VNVLANILQNMEDDMYENKNDDLFFHNLSGYYHTNLIVIYAYTDGSGDEGESLNQYFFYLLTIFVQATHS